MQTGRSSLTSWEFVFTRHRGRLLQDWFALHQGCRPRFSSESRLTDGAGTSRSRLTADAAKRLLYAFSAVSDYYSFGALSEIVAQSGADHEEIAVGIRDVLAAGLHVQRAGELAPPRHFNGVLAALLEKGILPREATRIVAVLINAAHFTIAAASV